MKTEGLVLSVDELSRAQYSDMLSLMQQCYANVTRQAFEHDLREKNWVILAIRPADRRVIGFSTQMLFTLGEDRNITILFSGDTIVDPGYWSRNPLAQLWGRMVLSLIDDMPKTELYWFLTSKGYKTYRYLPVFFKEFFPRFDQPTPTWARTIIHAVANQKFGSQFDPARGILRADNACPLRAGVASISSNRLRDPNVRFFQKRNPNHAEGDELCCLAKLTRDNFRTTAYRVIGLEKALADKR